MAKGRYNQAEEGSFSNKAEALQVVRHFCRRYVHKECVQSYDEKFSKNTQNMFESLNFVHFLGIIHSHLSC
jgi:hypothetical protein